MTNPITLKIKPANIAAVFIAAGLLSLSPAHAGNNPAAFLEQGVGARAMAMGGAFTAVSDDAAASYWNPAGLGKFTSIKSSMMLQSLAGDQWPGMENSRPGYQFFNVVVPFKKTGLLDSGSAALSVISMSIDDIPRTHDEGGNIVRDGSFSNKETAVILSGGYPLVMRRILIGGSLRYINQKFVGISGASASGFDIQVGKIISLTGEIDMGFTVERGPTLVWENGHRDSGEVKVKLGLGYSKQLSDKLKLLGTWDFIQKKDMPTQTSFGAELAIDTGGSNIPAIFTRGGINRFTIEDRYSYMSNLNNTIRWSMGLGMKMVYLSFDLRADYALISDAIGKDHLISLSLKF